MNTLDCGEVSCEDCSKDKCIYMKTDKNDVIDNIRAELIQSVQNGTIKIESRHEELFRIIDKYSTKRK